MKCFKCEKENSNICMVCHCALVYQNSQELERSHSSTLRHWVIEYRDEYQKGSDKWLVMDKFLDRLNVLSFGENNNEREEICPKCGGAGSYIQFTGADRGHYKCEQCKGAGKLSPVS